MADPKSASDDILGSIQRLVVDGQSAAVGDRLILTPNLRVVPSVHRAEPKDVLQPLHLESLTRPGLSQPQLFGRLAEFYAESFDLQPEAASHVPEPESLDAVSAPQAEPIPAPGADLNYVAQTEQSLRDLVRDLVREQFQGDLGLQITRNIRKLVKAEIAREMDLRAKD